jgi:hypothetical protein
MCGRALVLVRLFAEDGVDERVHLGHVQDAPPGVQQHATAASEQGKGKHRPGLHKRTCPSNRTEPSQPACWPACRKVELESALLCRLGCDPAPRAPRFHTCGLGLSRGALRPCSSAGSPLALSTQPRGVVYAHGLRLGAAELLAQAVGAKQEGDQDGPPHKSTQPPPASLVGNDARHGV